MLISRGGVSYEINRNFYTAYSVDRKFRIVLSDIVGNAMTIVIALEAGVGLSECDACIKINLPEISILKREEITSEQFERELTKAYRFEWIERSAESVFASVNAFFERSRSLRRSLQSSLTVSKRSFPVRSFSSMSIAAPISEYAFALKY